MPADLMAVAMAITWATLPGAVLATSIRLAGLWWFAALVPGSVAVIGTAGVFASWLGVPFGWGAPLLLALALGAFIEVGRLITRRRFTMQPMLGQWNVAAGVSAAAIGISAIVLAIQFGSSVDLTREFSQSYDGVFHLNAVAYVIDSGDASSFHLYRMTHLGDDNEFYPASWHAMAALVTETSYASIPTAANAVWWATSALGWIPGIALLSSLVVRDRAGIGGAIGAILGSATAAFPFLMLSWGTLYPTGLAYAILPFGVAIAITILTPWSRNSAGPVRWGIPVGWLVASCFAHPRSLFSFAALVFPLLVSWAWNATRRNWQDPRGRRRTITIGVVVLGVLAVITTAGVSYVWRTYDVANRPIADHLNGGPARASQTIPDAVAQALVLSPANAVAFPALLLAIAVLCGMSVALRDPRARWMVASWCIIVLLFALASGSDSDLAKLATGVWYKDQQRLLAILPAVAVPLATIGILRVGEIVSAPRARTFIVAATTALVAVTAWWSPAMSRELNAVRDTFALQPAGTPGVFVDEDEYEFLAKLNDHVPAGAIVAGNPWNGSAMSWAIGRRQALFPHLTGEWSPDALLVATSLDRARDDPAVCEAVHRLKITYMLDDPGMLWGNPAEAAAFHGISMAPASDVLREVARAGDTVLYRIAACDPSASED